MSIGDSIAVGALAVAVISCLIALGFYFGGLSKNVKTLNDAITGINSAIGIMKDGITSQKHSFSNIERSLSGISSQVTSLWEASLSKSNSPVQLNSTGEKILNESGIKKIIDNNLPLIIEYVKGQNPTNAYSGQQSVISAVNSLSTKIELKDALENGAFMSGTNVDAVLYVGAIYIRDRILQELGFSIEDIDKHVPV